MRLFNIGAGNDGAVLQHVLQIHQIAVVHVLGKVVGIVEVDQTLLDGPLTISGSSSRRAVRSLEISPAI